VNSPIPYVRDPQIRADTCERLRDYFEWHCQMGRGSWTVQTDRRGLGFLLTYLAEKLVGMLNLVTPLDGETHDEKRHVVYASVRF